jgi:hypothetical protein
VSGALGDIVARHASIDFDELPSYRQVLDLAATDCEPIFITAEYGEHFRRYAMDPNWVFYSLFANSKKEADGSRQLWALAARAAGEDCGALIKRHAVDEANHARAYVNLAFLVFPEATETMEAETIYRQLPAYRMSDEPPAEPPIAHERLIDEIAQMNMGEVRTLMNQLLMAPVLELLAPEANADKVARAVAGILEDETAHIRYTSVLLDGWARPDPKPVAQTYLQRLRDFNQLTAGEIRLGEFE